MLTSSLPANALAYATKQHRGQIRKFSGEGYVVHPVRVAATLTLFGLGTDKARAKAFLHDVVEDTNATLG